MAVGEAVPESYALSVSEDRFHLHPTYNPHEYRWGDGAALESALIQGVSRFRDPGRGQGLDIGEFEGNCGFHGKSASGVGNAASIAAAAARGPSRPEPRRADGRVDGAVTAHHDAGDLVPRVAQAREHVDAVAIGQRDIGDDDVG